MNSNETKPLDVRRERVFIFFASIFIAAMVMLNILGISKFVQIGPFSIPIGVLPYPLTFLCTDIISEFFGRKRATFLVVIGVLLNIFVLIVIYVGEWLPSIPYSDIPHWQLVFPATDDMTATDSAVPIFNSIADAAKRAIFASMVAFALAQLVDVWLFHYFRKLTKGKWLWLRNNASTMSSQLIDTFVVILITFAGSLWSGSISLGVVLNLFLMSYLFKVIAAIIDTAVVYPVSALLRRAGLEPVELEVGSPVAAN